MAASNKHVGGMHYSQNCWQQNLRVALFNLPTVGKYWLSANSVPADALAVKSSSLLSVWKKGFQSFYCTDISVDYRFEHHRFNLLPESCSWAVASIKITIKNNNLKACWRNKSEIIPKRTNDMWRLTSLMPDHKYDLTTRIKKIGRLLRYWHEAATTIFYLVGTLQRV